MPGIIAFNRRWVIASDELMIPFGIAVILRTAWLLMVGIVFGIHMESGHGQTRNKCKSDLSHIYFIVYIIILFLSACTDFTIAFISHRGSIFDREHRKSIPKLLYARTTLLVFEAVWAMAGCYLIFAKRKNNCVPSSHDKWLSEAVVIFNFIWVFGCLLVIFLTFDSAGRLWYKLDRKHRKRYGSTDTLETQKLIMEKYESDWLSTFKFLFCCTKTETSKDNVLLFAAKVFTQYFHKQNADLVPSDLLAGMILLRQKQKYEEFLRIDEELKNTSASYQQVTRHKTHRSVRRHQKTENSYPFDMENEDDVKLLDDVTYFAKYALASYGWPMYCLMNKIPCARPARRLLARIRCCDCCRKTPDYYPAISGDNCCLCNFATQKAYLDVNNDNFIYVSYSDEVFKTPFSVIVDNSKDSIVISCRGTLSLKDVLTDLAIEEEPIPGGEEGWTCHKGFLQAATAIKSILEEKQLIEQAQNFDTNKGSHNYQLTIVGHSLGAGTASLLAFLLRPKYPNIKCFAYGPSGSAISYEASVYARDFIHSVVLGKDIIGRLNLHTMNELQHNIMQMLEKTNLPKWRILHGCMCQCILCCTRSSDRSFDEYFSSVDEVMNVEPYGHQPENKLFMAGKVVHICKTKSIYPRFGRKKAAYKAYWSTPADFQNILISNLMLSDHFPDTLVDALNSILPKDIDKKIPTMNDDDTSICIEPPDYFDECEDNHSAHIDNESQQLIDQPHEYEAQNTIDTRDKEAQDMSIGPESPSIIL